MATTLGGGAGAHEARLARLRCTAGARRGPGRTRTRTNIEIDDDDVAAVMRRYAVRTRTEAVAIAREVVAVEPMTDEELLAVEAPTSR